MSTLGNVTLRVSELPNEALTTRIVGILNNRVRYDLGIGPPQSVVRAY